MDQRQARTECNVVLLYERQEKTKQEINKRVLTFFNLKDDQGALLGPEAREYNIIYWVKQVTNQTVTLTSANFSHFIPKTHHLSPESHVTFDNEQQMQMVKQGLRYRQIPFVFTPRNSTQSVAQSKTDCNYP